MPLYPRLLSRSIFSFLFLLSINPALAQAQIIPDATLPTSVQQLENMRKITGGERVGDNLFHSFEEFSIPSGMEAIFDNAIDIQNIFTRITGSEASFIDGLLQTQGAANFFLVNPNGIVFGENAVVDVGGSFIATTANTIDFGEGKVFKVRDKKPLLTWNAPIGLGLDGNNGSITVNNTGNQIESESAVSQIQFEQKPTGISVKEVDALPARSRADSQFTDKTYPSRLAPTEIAVSSPWALEDSLRPRVLKPRFKITIEALVSRSNSQPHWQT